MAKNNKNKEEVEKPYYTLHVITAFSIFQECFRRIGLLNNNAFNEDGWPKKLKKALVPYAIDPENLTDYWIKDYHNYLRDRFNEVKNFVIKDKAPKKLRRYYEHNFNTVLAFLNIENPYELDEQIITYIDAYPSEVTITWPLIINEILNPEALANSISVLYTPRPFGLLDILRNPDVGTIQLYENGDIVFHGNTNLYIKSSSVKDAVAYKMHGIPNTTVWAKIGYENDGVPSCAYFAETDGGTEVLKLTEPKKIIKLFSVNLPNLKSKQD